MQKLFCRIIVLIILIGGLSVSPFVKTIFAQEPPKQHSKVDPTQLISFARV